MIDKTEIFVEGSETIPASRQYLYILPTDNIWYVHYHTSWHTCPTDLSAASTQQLHLETNLSLLVEMATKNARSTFGCTPLTPECGISNIWCGFFESHVSPTITKNSTKEVTVRSSSASVRSFRVHDDGGKFRSVAPLAVVDFVSVEADPTIKVRY